MSKKNRAEKIPQEIREEAVAWLVRQDSQPLTGSEKSSFKNWLQTSPLHRKAWEEVQTLWSDLDALPAVPAPADKQFSFARKPAWVVTMAIAASLALFFFFPGKTMVVGWTADKATSIGEIRSVDLPDGSIAYLNTATAIDIEFSGERRTIHLLQGEAEFHVAHDTARPFVVKAGGGTATALGTVYGVRVNTESATVTVLESRVEVECASAQTEDRQREVLEPAQQVSYAPGTGLNPVRQVSLETADAWRQGKLIFEDEPLGDVIAELNRYHPGHIQVIGGALNRMTVNGVFPVDDPLKAIDALEKSLHLSSSRLGDLLILLYL